MTMNATASPEASPVVEQSPWPSELAELGTRPDVGMDGASETPDAEATPAATPPTDFVPKAEFEALKKQAEELAAWRTAQETEKQEAQRAQATQQQTEILDNIGTYFKQFEPYGMDKDDAEFFTGVAKRIMTIDSPEFQQTLRAVSEQHAALERERDAREVVKTHLRHVLSSNLTPAQAVAQLDKWEMELLSFGQGKQVMESLAKRWASDRIAINGQKRLESGAEATERGGGFSGGGKSNFVRYQEQLRTGAPITFTNAEINQMMAERYRV